MCVAEVPGLEEAPHNSCTSLCSPPPGVEPLSVATETSLATSQTALNQNDKEGGLCDDE